MNGSVKELKADKDDKYSVKDESTKLPATVKFEVKSVKKANYEEYKDYTIEGTFSAYGNGCTFDLK